MKLLSYIQEGVTRVGVHTEAGILDVEHALTASGYLKGTSSVTLQNVIAGGLEMLSHLNGLAGQAVSGTVPESDAVVLLDESTLQLAPVFPGPVKLSVSDSITASTQKKRMLLYRRRQFSSANSIMRWQLIWSRYRCLLPRRQWTMRPSL